MCGWQEKHKNAPMKDNDESIDETNIDKVGKN